MKKELLSYCILFFSAVHISAQASKSNELQVWKNDVNHSMIGFSVKHLNVSYICGDFKNYSIKVEANESDLSDMRIDVVVETNSIDTGIEQRDNHLRSEDFFDVEKYPTMTFKSTSFLQNTEDTGILKGNLTLHGHTRPLELTVHFLGKVKNEFTNNVQVVGFQVLGQLNRLDYGIGDKFPNNLISDNVDIILNLEFSPTKK